MATILIVDDRETNRLLIRAILGSKSHNVIEAVDGEDGLAKAIKHRPELIITDVLMPRVDGFEFLRNLRGLPEFELTPVIVCTATFMGQEAESLAERCGVYKVLLRPTEPELLLTTVDEAMRAEPKRSDQVLDESFGAQHRRLLTDKLAQKVADLEQQITISTESEARLAAALSASGQRVFEWNASTDEIILTGADPVGGQPVAMNAPLKKFFSAVHADDLPVLIAASDRARSDHSDLKIRYRYVANAGVERIIELRGRYHYDDQGAPTKMYGALEDVTERVEAEETALFLASIVEHSSDFIGSADAKGIVKFINTAGRNLLGDVDHDSLIGGNMFGTVHPNDVDYLREKVLPDMLADGGWRGELQFLNLKTGDPIPCDCSSFVIRDIDGNITDLAIIARDVRMRKATLKQSNMRLAQLTALHRIDLAISGAIDIQLTLQIVINEVLEIDSISAAYILIYDPSMRHFESVTGSGMEDESQIIALAESAVSRRRVDRKSLRNGENLVTFPLLAKGSVKGVLAVVQRSGHEYESTISQFVEAIASQTAIAIENTILFEDLQRSKNDLAIAYDETLEGWSRALDLRDKETEGHSQRVTDLAMKVGREMRLSSEALQHLRRGALLHDIGKVGVPDNILLKPGPLTDVETAIMRKHTDFAFQFLSPIAFLKEALDIPYCHHEKWDGTGYPRGLKTNQIPLGARIFAIADVYDALTSDRPYRKAWSRGKTLEYIKAESGKHFDPAVVSAFFRVMNAIPLSR